MEDEVVTIRFSKWDIERIERAVDGGFFTNRSDFIRAAARRMVDEIDSIPPEVRRMMGQAARKGITREDVILASKAARMETHRRRR